jgi:hypothetical protein
MNENASANKPQHPLSHPYLTGSYPGRFPFVILSPDAIGAKNLSAHPHPNPLPSREREHE